MWSHGVPDVLVDFRPLVEGFHDSALQQVLVPLALLPQHSSQNVLGTGMDLYGHFPLPQWKTIINLRHRERTRRRPITLQPLLIKTLHNPPNPDAEQ